MKIIKNIIFSFVVSLISVNFVSQIAGNQVFAQVEGGTDCGSRTLLGIPAWDKYLIHEEVNGRCSPVVNGAEAILPISIAVLEAAISLAGLVAVVMIIVGSFRYITSQGNSDNAAAARKTIINSLVGLVIVIIATAVVSFIGGTLTDISIRELPNIEVIA